jgi:hypothetical protein
VENSLPTNIYQKYDLYILSTPYHVLIALGNILNNKKDVHIILTSLDDESLYFFNSIKLKLQNIDNVKKVEVIKQKKNITRLLDYKITSPMINSEEYKCVYIFGWNLYYAYSNTNKFINYFYKKKTKIFLFEDGKKMYEAAEKSFLFFVIAKLLNINTFPKNLYKIRKIFVSEPENFPEKYKSKLYQIDIEAIEYQIASNKNTILDIFTDQESLNRILSIFNMSKSVSIIFTQPLYKDGIVKSEENQKIIYEKLAMNYADTSDFLIVKKHPRDNLIYDFEDKLIEWSGMLPSELLSLLNIKFKNSIGINSSAIESVDAENYCYNNLKDL